MSLVTITLGSKTFQLACSKGSEQELTILGIKLNERLVQIKKSNLSASFELLLVMAALSLEEEVQALTTQMTNASGGKIPLKEEEQFAETLSTIASYLENLAKKIGK
ncbi:cell division protein ZapA [Candidatus Tisiphia endosymbiont of Nemotelus uliginosus]|uniref:cell division protein ZapA n=1 Tax=Candidatus Tisiphia endosymbiont of Nemotelus uliginosus TaxID=3077926 RepID=UPI0035C89A0A